MKYPIRWTLVILAGMISLVLLVLISLSIIDHEPLATPFWVVIGAGLGYIGGSMNNLTER